VLSSLPATEETGAMGREIEPAPGWCVVLNKKYPKESKPSKARGSNPWRRGIVVIASAYRTDNSGFESRQGVPKVFRD
jgi:hypothetical protein